MGYLFWNAIVSEGNRMHGMEWNIIHGFDKCEKVGMEWNIVGIVGME
jgi:hypothetical protein